VSLHYLRQAIVKAVCATAAHSLGHRHSSQPVLQRNSVAVVRTKLAEGDECVSALLALALDVPADRIMTKHFLVTTRELPEEEYDDNTDDGFTLWGRNEMASLWHDSVRKWAARVRDVRYTNE